MSELIRVTHGVWRPQEVVGDLPGMVAACIAGCAADAVVSGVTAARLHGFWLPELPDGPVEVIVHRDEPRPAQRAGGRRAEIRARRRMLRDDDVMWCHGLVITSPARTWFDLAERLTMPDLVAAGDYALRAGATLDELARLLREATHRPGVVAARTALPLLDRRSRSRPESHLRYAIVNAGLPKPAVNEPIHTPTGEWLAEPDLSYDDVRLALEYNGADHAEPRRMRRDITRELDVVHRGGWQSITFGPAEVFGRPDCIPRIVRQVRADRARLPRVRWREIA